MGGVRPTFVDALTLPARVVQLLARGAAAHVLPTQYHARVGAVSGVSTHRHRITRHPVRGQVQPWRTGARVASVYVGAVGAVVAAVTGGGLGALVDVVTGVSVLVEGVARPTETRVGPLVVGAALLTPATGITATLVIVCVGKDIVIV